MAEAKTRGYGHEEGIPVGTTKRPRCRNCNKVLAFYVSSPWKIKCSRCGVVNGSP